MGNVSETVWTPSLTSMHLNKPSGIRKIPSHRDPPRGPSLRGFRKRPKHFIVGTSAMELTSVFLKTLGKTLSQEFCPLEGRNSMGLPTRHWDRHGNGGLTFTELGLGTAPLEVIVRACFDSERDF